MGKNKFCQSCGMPMKLDENHGGTNADGSKSQQYCSYCYTDGSFNDDFTDYKQMVDFVKEKLREQGYSRLTSFFYTLNIKKLDRWN